MPLVDGAAAAATMQSWRTCDPGLCLHYVWEAYAAHGATSAQSYPTALSAWEASGQQHPGDWDPPLGVPVYLGARADSSAGDVFISLGGGRGVGTDWPGWGTIGEFSIQERINQTGRPYLGWAGDILGNPIIQGADDMDYDTFLSYLQRAFTYDLRPKGAGTPGQTWEAGPTFFEQWNTAFGRFDNLDAAVAKIDVGDVDIDYDQLAASLKAQGITVAIIQPNT